jgi:monofunctional biosynthetic peptidoglycan transglycosylase
MESAKRRTAWRVTPVIAAVVLAWLLGVWPPPVWWRDHAPRRTAMMRHAVVGRVRPTLGPPVPLSTVSPALQRMVIIAEDSRFRTHWGIDVVELREAARAGLRRGASTITQQLAKNLYLSSARNPLRKVKEAATAVRLEAALSKDRILDLYLNTAEWGNGIWGIDAASRAYFGVGPSALSEEQAAALAATLPFPRSSNPRFRPARMLARRDLILARYRGHDVVVPPVLEVELDSLFDSIAVPTVVIDSVLDSIPIPPIPDDTGPSRPT